VLPRASRRLLLACLDDVPGGASEVRVPISVLVLLQCCWSDVSFREVGHWVPTWFKEQDDALAISDPCSAETHAHAPPQWLYIKKPLGQLLWNKKPTNCSR
jgi:hypothetical protein